MRINDVTRREEGEGGFTLFIFVFGKRFEK